MIAADTTSGRVQEFRQKSGREAVLVGFPQWTWALMVGWSGVAIGVGVRLYRTRRDWMRKYRNGRD